MDTNPPRYDFAEAPRSFTDITVSCVRRVNPAPIRPIHPPEPPACLWGPSFSSYPLRSGSTRAARSVGPAGRRGWNQTARTTACATVRPSLSPAARAGSWSGIPPSRRLHNSYLRQSGLSELNSILLTGEAINVHAVYYKL